MPGSARGGRSPRVLRLPPVDPFEPVAKLCRRDRDSAVDHRGPDETAAFEPLGGQRHADPVMPEKLDQIVFAAAEFPEIAGVRIMLQALLNLQGQPAHAPPQVAVAGCNPDLDTARNRDHRASNRSVVDTSASGAFAMICTRARPISTTIAAAGTAGGVDVKLSR